MNSHDLTVTVYLAIVLVGVFVQYLSTRPGSRIPSVGQVCTRVMRTRSGRVGVIAGWAWLGLHFFAR
jgi:uncharacterized protein DUF6186